MNHETYQIGGSLPFDAPSYVTRSADQELYTLLLSREFCYVLNARQMGKSSLRVRLMQRLQAEGIACADIDITLIGTQQISPQQWYGSLIRNLVNQFNFQEKFDQKQWLSDRQELTPVHCFSEFIEEILLKGITQPLVIFIDEIDSVLQLEFKDDFFALIRACYNKRADHPDYKRLTFVLLGVATPADLIGNPLVAPHRTPFNVGLLIELHGFQLPEGEPLVDGLVSKSSNPKAVLQAILSWTGGQPFLTQKLCCLVKNTESFISAGTEVQRVEELVQSRVLKNWESQDNPEHLKTIRDRLLQSGEQHTGRLLGLYQHILQQRHVAADASPEQMQLRLSGLVVKQENQLTVYNLIYALVFNQHWLDKVLADLRPYAESFNAWAASNYQDESRLLRGNALQDASNWAAAKSLSDLDYKYLSASRDLEGREVEAALVAQKQANEILTKARKRAIRISIGAIAALVVSMAISGWIVNKARQAEQKVALADVSLSMQRSEATFGSEQTFSALILGLQSAQKLKTLDPSLWGNDYTQVKVLMNLLKAVYSVREQNTLIHEKAVVFSTFSPDEQTIATSSGESLKLWRRNGSLFATLSTQQKDSLRASVFSPDGKRIAIANSGGTVQLWKPDGTLLTTFKGHNGSVGSIDFSPDGQMIATGGNDKTVNLWKLDGTLVKALTGHKYGVRAVSFSPDGQTIASASDNVIKLWKRDGKLLKTFIGPRNSGKGIKLDPNNLSNGLYTELFSESGISFSPDSQTIATGGLDGTVRLWKRNGSMTLLAGHGDIISDFSFSPDGQTIATASGDKTIKLWQLNGNLLQTFTGHSGRVNSVGFSPDGKFLISASGDKSIKIWQLNGQVYDTLTGHNARVLRAKFAKDGKTILSMSEDKTAKIWNWKGISHIKIADRDLQKFSEEKDNKFEKTSYLKDVLKEFGPKIREKKGKFNSISFSPDSKTLATASEDGRVRLWKIDATLLKTLFQKPKVEEKGYLLKPIFYLGNADFSPDGTTIASANGRDTVQLWKMDGMLLDTLDIPGSQIIKYSPDGKVLATDGHSEPPYTSNVATLFKQDGTIIATLTGHSDHITDISFSPDGKTVATASHDKTIKLWKLDGTLLNTLKGHQKVVDSVSFSPDGKTVLSSSRDTTIKLWKLDGKETQSFTGDDISISSSRFSPDGQIIAAVSGHDTVNLWTSSGQGLLEYRSQLGKRPDRLSFSPNGELLAITYTDGTVQMMNISLDSLADLGCSWIQNYLTSHPEQKRDLKICQG